MKNNPKIKNVKELANIIEKLKKKGKSVGLVTGCFDVIHYGHIELFKLAKKHVDFLIVGIDNDKSIQLSKGKDRPIFNFQYRANVVAGMESVDYVFKIVPVFKFSNTPDVHAAFLKLTKKLGVTKIITNSRSDDFYKGKISRCKELGVEYVDIKRKRTGSSSKIIEKLGLM